MAYCWIKTLKTWPYTRGRFSKAESHVLARHFDSEPLFHRPWDIYHYETATNDFFLVPAVQVLDFFAFVARDTGLDHHLAGITERQITFRIDPNEPYDPPAFLGTVRSLAEYNTLQGAHRGTDPDKVVKRTDAKKHKQKKQKAKKSLVMQNCRAQVGCARRYLGIGYKDCVADEGNIPPPVLGKDLEPVVLIAVDVEAWEKDHSCITEIGISILDTAEISGTLRAISSISSEGGTEGRPKPVGDAIISMIKTRHIRVLEHRSLRNGLYVSDCADKFEFGQSEWVSLEDIPSVVGEYFRHFDEHGNRRKVVLVGHDVTQDVTYLRKIGYDVWNIKDLEILDTAQMFKAITEDNDTRSLGTILADFDIIFWNLHNAGNDAHYTLQAFVKSAEKGVPQHDYWTPPSTPPDYEDLAEAGCIRYTDNFADEKGKGSSSKKTVIVNDDYEDEWTKERKRSDALWAMSLEEDPK